MKRILSSNLPPGRLRQTRKTQRKRTWPISSHLDRSSLVNNAQISTFLSQFVVCRKSIIKDLVELPTTNLLQFTEWQGVWSADLQVALPTLIRNIIACQCHSLDENILHKSEGLLCAYFVKNNITLKQLLTFSS